MWEPVAHRVLIELEKVGEMAGKEGLIHKPKTVQDMEQRQIDKGTVVKIGPQAFLGFADGAPWCAEGDSVAFAKHAGALMEDDGKMYRIINDDDIYARLSK